MACRRALARYGSELGSEEARCQRTDLLHASRSTNTDSIDDDGILMLGSGKKCKKAESRLCQKALSEHLRDFQTNAWSSATPIFKTYECFLYDRFALKVGEIVHCKSYNAAKSRRSYYCIVKYTESHGDVTYMAKIKLAFRLRKVQSGVIFKIAIADFFAVEDVSDYLGEYHTLSETGMQATYLDYPVVPVVISKLDHKVVFGNLTRTIADNLKVDKWIFVPYSHVQSYTDPRA